MSKLVILVFSFFLLFSCASSPKSPENTQFQKDAGVSLTFVKRGLYSIPKQYNDTGFESYYNKLTNNQIIFSLNETQTEFAVFLNEDENMQIKINPMFIKYKDGSKNALITATAYAIGLLETGNTSLSVIEERFYNIISDYAKYGVDVSSIVKDEAFKDRKFKITNEGINI